MKLLYRCNVKGRGTRGTPLKITGIDHNGREEFIHEEPTPIQVYKKSKDDIQHDSRIPTPKVFQYYKYMPEDNTRYDAGKPTPGVATPKVFQYYKYVPQDNTRYDTGKPTPKVFQYYKYVPQDNTRDDTGKPTPGVATLIIPSSKEVFQYSKQGPQENMQQSADKPTLGVETAIAPAG
jgi:hypothetical protein